jgi:Holliday junction resolvasome RuvABC endonuclease subunit
MVKISLFSDQPKNICAIDASTNSLAFAIFCNKELKASGKIKFTGADTYTKVGDAARKSLAFLEKFSIDAIVIEHTVFMNSPKTAADLALVQGGLLGAARIAGIKRFGSVSPITWQNYIGNKKLDNMEKLEIAKQNPNKAASTLKTIEREVRKQKTIRFVNAYYDKNISDNDVADAVAIGHYAINNLVKVGF